MTFRVNLALEELTLNTMTHGRHDELEAIVIMLDSKEDLLTIEITDNGLPFNPLEEAPDPGVDAALAGPEHRRVGGLPGPHPDGRNAIQTGGGQKLPDSKSP